MKIRLQVRRMWEAVQDSNVDHLEDRRALDALIAAVPPEMQVRTLMTLLSVSTLCCRRW